MKNDFLLNPNSMKIILFVLIFTSLQFYCKAQNIVGKVYSTSDCYSGKDFDYYFFEDNILLVICVDCKSKPHVLSGKWSVNEQGIQYQLSKEWKGNPVGKADEEGNYAIYTALSVNIDQKDSMELTMFSDDYESRNCIKVIKNELKSSNPHAALKTAFVGRFPQSSERLITTADLKGLNPKDLRLMRNEIYARYGLIFKSKDLATYFEKQVGYEMRLDNAEAFLSEIEQKNIAFIKKYEAK